MGLAVRHLVIAIVAVGLDLALFTQLSDASDQVSWVSRSLPAPLILGVGALAAIPLALRHRAPALAGLIVAGHAILVTTTLGSRPLVSLLVALYTAAVWSNRGRAIGCLVAVLIAHTVAVVYEASFTPAAPSRGAVGAVAAVYGLLDLATWAAGRWGAGAAARSRARELEASRTAMAAAAVDAERLRIARELHDIVAHAVTVMVLQSAGARRTALKNPARAVEAMAAVETTGKQAIVELRRLLDVLRAGESGPEPAAPAEEGVVGLAGLDDLVRVVRATGIDVQVSAGPATGALDPSVDLAAYRVIQEALTNVNKHAGTGARAEVRLHWTSDSLVIEVTDGGPVDVVPVPIPSGYGLVGLAERVKLVGGRLHTGPRSDGSGYRVEVVLPFSRPEPQSTGRGLSRTGQR